MADDPTPAAETDCPQCGFSNAANRTFCQDCGARLVGGSGGPVPSGARPVAETTAVPQTGTRKSRKSRKSRIRPDGERPRPTVRSTIGAVLRITLYAAILAAIIQILRSPGPPPDFPLMPASVSQSMRDRLTDASGSGAGTRMAYPWSLINGYLAERVPAAVSGENRFFKVEFIRATAEPIGENVHLAMERRVNGRPMFLSFDYHFVSRDNGGTTARIVGGSLGRLPLPGVLAAALGGTAKPVYEKLFYELDILAEARVVTISPESAAVTFP